MTFSICTARSKWSEFFENLRVERKKMIFIRISSASIFLNTWWERGLFLFERGGRLFQFDYFWIVLILKLSSCIQRMLALLPKITFFAFFSLFWRFDQWKNWAWYAFNVENFSKKKRHSSSPQKNSWFVSFSQLFVCRHFF